MDQSEKDKNMENDSWQSMAVTFFFRGRSLKKSLFFWSKR